MLELSNLWYSRLEHINYSSLLRLVNWNHILSFHIDSKYKCETYIEAKMMRYSFQTIKSKTKLLNVIHSGICDLKFAPIRGDNKYFISFVNDSTKYGNIYMLKSRDKTIEKFFIY